MKLAGRLLANEADVPRRMQRLVGELAEQREARLALDVYVHRLRGAVAAMAGAMNGLEALVFTGGVGENAPAVRERAAEGLSFLGVKVDRDRNKATGDTWSGRGLQPKWLKAALAAGRKIEDFAA